MPHQPKSGIAYFGFFQARSLISLAKLGKSLTAIAGSQPGLHGFRKKRNKGGLKRRREKRDVPRFACCRSLVVSNM